ncbi:cytochrome c7 [Geomonas sp.]|uniref:cytochrome c7 n=1 Tax=Geomonas sp. TaxID=2651584 RepID=UPI002B4914E4|nr:cytochrome c7 [Geomonas sp.]HJV33937.1 cytochrome c7 [Geomonas sp.]
MKKIIVLTAAALALTSGVVFAADTITLPAKNGNVTFNHKKHQEQLKDCKICHEKGPGKIEGFGKDMAHKTCKGCHADKGAGPTKCSECHKK